MTDKQTKEAKRDRYEVLPDRKAKTSWQSKITGSPVLIISLIFHIVLVILAGYLIVQRTKSTRKPVFTENPIKTQSLAIKQIEQKADSNKRQNSLAAPDVSQRLKTPDISAISLPDVPMPTDSTGDNGKMGPASFGGGNGGTGGGNGGEVINMDVSTIALSAFGSIGGNGLKGEFYDFTRTPQMVPVKPAPFGEIIHNLINNGWKPSQQNPHFTSPTKIFTNYLIVPLIRDEEAGKAFNSPESSRAFWMVHYTGKFQSEEGGSFRFYGFGDNIMIVKIDDKIVLDASDLQYLKMPFQKMGMEGIFPGGNKPVYKGDAFDLTPQKPVSIDILIGDEGGVTTSGLFIQKGNAPVTFTKNFTPELPLFTVAPFTEADRKRLSAFLPPICLTRDTELTNVSDDQ